MLAISVVALVLAAFALPFTIWRRAPQLTIEVNETGDAFTDIDP